MIHTPNQPAHEAKITTHDPPQAATNLDDTDRVQELREKIRVLEETEHEVWGRGQSLIRGVL